MMKIKLSIIATLLFLSLLLVIYYIHIEFFRVNVVLYSAIADAIIATVVSGYILFITKYFIRLNNFEKTQLILIWLLAGYSLAISIPTVIDRSLSFYILEKIHQRGDGIKFDAFEQVFTKEYVKEHRLVEVRLTEQQQSGTIVIQNGCVKLTPRGKMLVRFSRFFRQHFLPKQRLLLDKYSDDLVDPFRNTDKQFKNKYNYLCQ